VEDQRPPPGDLTEKTPDEESVTETIVDEQAGQSATDEADGETRGDESDVEDVDKGAADDVESDNAITESEDGETESDQTAAVGDDLTHPGARRSGVSACLEQGTARHRRRQYELHGPIGVGPSSAALASHSV
jgi:hypothetical protein